jgi:hypothetical protein
MPQFTAISRDSHTGKNWQRFKGYIFASTSALAPIVGVEIVGNPVQRGHRFQRKADSNPVIADSR